MTSLDPESLSAEQLAPMLRAWAAGLLAGEAAVELLIRHDVWLHRRDFRAALVDAVDDGWGTGGSIEPMAAVDWERVENFLDTAPSSSSEARILRLAASLAGAALRDSLLAMTASLDDTNATLVLRALAHRFGWHERGRTVEIALAGAR